MTRTEFQEKASAHTAILTATALALVMGLFGCGEDGLIDSNAPDCPKGSTTGDAGGSGNTGGEGGDAGGGTGNTGNEGMDEPLATGQTTGKDGNTFDHFNDPGASGSKDPFEILKERAQEGPPEIRTRLHSCTKPTYVGIGNFLSSRGVDLGAQEVNGLPSAGQLYQNGKDALGVARFDAREGETYFHTAAGATKLFDIFVQAAPEIIANIANAPACQIGGQGFEMFSSDDGACVYESLTCIMGRPATEQELILCNQMVSEADGTPGDIAKKRNITVAAFLAAAHTCE